MIMLCPLEALNELPEAPELETIFEAPEVTTHTIVLATNLYQKIKNQAYTQGISTETLANLLLAERLEQITHQK